PAPHQVKHAMLLAGGEDRSPLGPRGIPAAPAHRERLCDLLGELAIEPRALSRAHLEAEHGAHEEPPALRVGRVLLRGDDIRTALAQELRHGGDDPRTIGADDYKTGQRHTTASTGRMTDGVAIIVCLAGVARVAGARRDRAGSDAEPPWRRPERPALGRLT